MLKSAAQAIEIIGQKSIVINEMCRRRGAGRRRRAARGAARLRGVAAHPVMP